MFSGDRILRTSSRTAGTDTVVLPYVYVDDVSVDQNAEIFFCSRPIRIRKDGHLGRKQLCPSYWLNIVRGIRITDCTVHAANLDISILNCKDILS